MEALVTCLLPYNSKVAISEPINRCAEVRRARLHALLCDAEHINGVATMAAIVARGDIMRKQVARNLPCPGWGQPGEGWSPRRTWSCMKRPWCQREYSTSEGDKGHRTA